MFTRFDTIQERDRRTPHDSNGLGLGCSRAANAYVNRKSY